MQPVCVSPEAALELLSRLGEVLQKACTLIVHIVKDVVSATQRIRNTPADCSKTGFQDLHMAFRRFPWLPACRSWADLEMAPLALGDEAFLNCQKARVLLKSPTSCLVEAGARRFLDL